MGKQKKIGIKFFLNKRLKPEVIDDKEYYRVYVRVAYNRLSTQFYFPLLYGFGYLTEEQFERFFVQRQEHRINEQVQYFEKLIETVIRFESRVTGDDYQITGLPSRLEYYQQPMLPEMERHLKQCLRDHLQEALPAGQLDAAFHKAMFLEDSFYLVADNIKPGLKESLPLKLSNEIAAFVQFRAFAGQYNGLEREYFIFLDWLEGRHQIAFKEFLFSPDDSREIFKNESPSSPAIRFYKDFPIDPLKIPICLQSIDNMILSIAM